MKNSGLKKYIISADVGGSHITVAGIDLTDKKIIDETRLRLSVNSNGTWAEILCTWANALKVAMQRIDAGVNTVVAIAMPGPFDYKNGISWIKGLGKYEDLYGLNIKQYLASELGIGTQHIIFRNDAEAFLHGEVFAGAGLGFNKVIGITLGTGLGSAKSSDGITTDVNRGNSAFGESIADDYMSTRWFVKRYSELAGKTVANVKELVRHIENDNDAFALQVFEEFTNNLMLFLKDFIDDEQPDVLIIGGNIARASQLFLPALKRGLAGFFDGIDIKIAQLGEDSAIMGAAASFEDAEQANN